MNNKSVSTASFYYSLNMLKLLQDMNLVSEDEAAKIKKSLSEHLWTCTELPYIVVLPKGKNLRKESHI